MPVSTIQHDTVALYRTLAQIDTGAKKEWANMTLLEKLLKVITLGIYSPTLSLGERADVKSIFSSIVPVEASGRLYASSPSMTEFACATFEDGVELHCMADERQNVILYCSSTLDHKCKKVLKLTEKQSRHFLDALPPMSYPLHGSHPLVHHLSEEGNMLAGVNGQLTPENIRRTEREALEKCTKRVEIQNPPRFSDSQMLMDFQRSFLTTEININGAVLTRDARTVLHQWILKNPTFYNDGTLPPADIVEKIVSLCEVTDSAQKMSVKRVLSSSGGMAALVLLTSQCFFLTEASLEKEIKMTLNCRNLQKPKFSELYSYGTISWPIDVIGEEPVSYRCVTSCFKFASNPNPESILDVGLLHHKVEYNISANETLSADINCSSLQRSAAVVF